MNKVSRTTSKSKRILAFALALVMVLTLFTSVGQRELSKAADYGSKPIVFITDIPETTFNLTGNYDAPEYSNTFTPESKKIYYAGGENAECLIGVAPNCGYDLMGSPAFESNTIESGSMSTGYSYEVNGGEKEDYQGTNIYNSVRSCKNNDVVKVYMYVNMTKAGGTEQKKLYILLGTYTVEKKNSISSGGQWANTNGIAKTATMENINVESWLTDASTNKTAGKIGYGYAEAKYNDDNTLKEDFESYEGSVSWSSSPLSGKSLNSGKYIGFVGYFDRELEGALCALVEEPRSIGDVEIDATAPVIDSAKVFYKNTDASSEITTDTAKRNVNSGNKIIIEAIVTEKHIADNGVKLSDGTNTYVMTKDFSFSGATDQYRYTYEFTDFMDSTKTYTVSVEDKVALNATSSSLPKITNLDTNKKDLTVTWDDNQAIPLTSSFVDGVNTQHTLHIAATTYNSMDYISVKYKDATGTDKVENIQLTNNTSPEGYYTYLADFKMPDDAALNNNYKYDSVSVDICTGAVGSLTVINSVTGVGSLLYDKTNPEITWDSASVILPSASDNIVWFGKDKAGSTATVTANSGSGSVESNMSSASYESINGATSVNETMTITSPSTSTDPAVIAVPESATKEGTTIKFTLTDVAGNTSYPTSVFYLDYTDPIVPSGEKISVANGDFSVNEDTSSESVYFKTNPNINVKFTDNIGIVKVVYTVTKDAETPITYTDTLTDSTTSYISNDRSITLQTLLESNPLTPGKYVVSVKAVDVAGNESETKTITFSYDDVAPTMSSYSFVKLPEGKTDWDAESEAISGLTDPYFINTNPAVESNKYAFKVTFTDNKSGVDEAKVVASNTSDWYSIEKGASDTDGVIYLVVDKSKLSSLTAKTVNDLVLYDVAGNASVAQTLTPSLLAVDQTMTFSATLMLGNTAVDVTDAIKSMLANGTNENYSVKITATSSNPFTEVYLTDANGKITNATDDVKINNAYDNNVKRYTYETVISLPTSDNRLFTNMKAYGKDDLNNEKSADLCTILFDKTKPVINNTVPQTWVSSATLGVTANSGNGSAESNIASAVYSLANGADVDFPVINGVNANTNGVVIPESATTNGTSVAVSVVDVAGNPASATYTYYVDATRPVVDSLLVNGNATNTIPLTGNPTITTSVSDNLTLKQVNIQVKYPTGDVKDKTFDYASNEALLNGDSNNYSYTVEALSGTYAPDGSYSVTVTAVDKAGNTAFEKTTIFKIDNTIPVVSVKITDDTIKSYQSAKNESYYNGNVTLQFTLAEVNLKTFTATDNGKPIALEWGDGVANYVVSAEGAHDIRIGAVDQSGHAAVEKTAYFIIDKTVPTVSASVNGLVNPSNVVDLMATANVSASIADASTSDLFFQTIVTKPDSAEQTSTYVLADSTSFSYDTEADYVVNFFAVDSANNQGPVRSISFRVDKTAPEVAISGIPANNAANEAVTVNLSVRESFWKDANASYTIYRKPGDGVPEVVMKKDKINLSSANTSISAALTESGIYRIEMEASDRAGHETKTSQTLTIDKEKPSVKLGVTASNNNVDNYKVINDSVDLNLEVNDEFYSTKTVTVKGTRTDIDGKKNDIQFAEYNEHANPTVITEKFEEDGIYEITISAKDAAGNADEREIHFTIDKTAPVIKSLAEFDGAKLTSFDFDLDADDLVSDLTVCDVTIMLNGSEYDGSPIEDGAYVLEVVAVDEAGLESKETASFVLDTKAPVFIVTGVEDGEVKNEEYTITVSLQLDEDKLTEVTLNGSVVTVENNQASISVTEKGNYELHMKAVDEAGNEAEQTITFKYGQKSNILSTILIILGILLVVGGIIIVVVKRKKKD